MSGQTRSQGRLVVSALPIGHGDATLMRYSSGDASWDCLVDGGESPTALRAALQLRGVDRLDLVVATHFDSDHIAGLMGLADLVKVDTYWAPALPAFERHRWLFGTRAQQALERGSAVENMMRAGGADIVYPLEGYSMSLPAGGGVSAEVLSPPGRLIQRLLSEADVEWLLGADMMPLGWLVAGAEPEVALEGPLAAIAQQVRSGWLSPDTVPAVLARETPARDGIELRRREWAERTGCDQEFFGDGAFNNASVVVWLEVDVGSLRYRLLLPGDQENWTYLAARNPRGLRADVLKATHHGGRVYLESDEALDEVMGLVRPRVVLFSANGRHDLPRRSMRDTAARWGATVFCTCDRAKEVVLAARRASCDARAEEKCCFKAYGCRPDLGADVILDGTGIWSERAACISGAGGEPGPVIQVRQHIIDPSAVVARLTEGELRGHLKMVTDYVESIHKERHGNREPGDRVSRPVDASDVVSFAAGKGNWRLSAVVEDVVREGWRRQQFWVERDRSGAVGWSLYSWPTPAARVEMLEWLKLKSMVLFPALDAPAVDRRTLIGELDVASLAWIAEAVTGFPSEMFRDCLWPWLSQEFSRYWSAWQHMSGRMCLSQLHEASALAKSIVEADDGSLDQSLVVASVDRRSEPLGGMEAIRRELDTWKRLREKDIKIGTSLESFEAQTKFRRRMEALGLQKDAFSVIEDGAEVYRRWSDSGDPRLLDVWIRNLFPPERARKPGSGTAGQLRKGLP